MVHYMYIQNPSAKIAPNKDKTLQIYNEQIWKLDQSLQDKRDVTESEAKLQFRIFWVEVKSVTPKQQQMLKSSDVQNFIPLRAVWNGNLVHHITLSLMPPNKQLLE